jgi:pimeloyl-ACP methyl ester carboxylesterase
MRDLSDPPAALVSRIDALATRQLSPCGAGWMVWRVWGDGHPLVLLHGASGSWTHWIRNIPSLATRFHVLVPDMPGFGDSDMPPEPHTADTLADVIASGLHVVVPPPGQVDMAGFSFGGIIAGLVAARMGRRLGNLVLLGAGGFGLRPVATPPLSQIGPDMTPADIERVHRENLQTLMIAEPRNADDLAVFVQGENVRRARFKSGAIPASDILLKALPSIRARIGGIWAGRDAFVASRAERIEEYRRILASVQPDLDFRVIADSGHWSMYEAAGQVNAALCDMLRVRATP